MGNKKITKKELDRRMDYKVISLFNESGQNIQDIMNSLLEYILIAS